MSKNMTRKGLAIGASFALIVSAFAGVAPASASTATTITPFVGSETNSVLGATMTYKVTANAASRVRFLVEGANPTELVAEGDFETAAEMAGHTKGSDVSTTSVHEVDLSTASAKATQVSVGADGDTFTAGQVFVLRLSLTGVTTTRTLKITPFTDSIVFNDGITAGEYAGTPIETTFYKASEVTATTTLAAPVAAAAQNTLKAVVKLGQGVNMGSTTFSSTNLQVEFKKDGSATFDSAAKQNATFTAADAGYVANSNASGNIAVASVYSAQAFLGGAANGNVSVGSPASQKVTGLSDFATESGNSHLEATGGATQDAVRSGAGSITVSATVSVATGDPKAGHTVTFKVQEGGAANPLDAAATVTSGGKTLKNASSTNSTENITVDAITDADGIATVTISYAGLKAGNEFGVSASAVGATQTHTEAGTIYRGADSSATAVVDVAAYGGSGDTDDLSPSRTVAKGGSVAVTYKLVDQFGQTPAGTFRARMVADSSAGTITSTQSVSGSGEFTFSFSDNSLGNTAKYDAYVDVVEKLGTDGVTWTVVLGTLSTKGTYDVTPAGGHASPAYSRIVVAPAADATAVTVAANGFTASTDKLRVATTAISGADVRVTQSSVDVLANTQWAHSTSSSSAAGNSYLSGTVRGATGAALGGKPVTISSPNALFVVTDGGTTNPVVYGVGSVTVHTNEDGVWSNVYIASNRSGKQTVTVTSGTATKTLDVTFAAAVAGAVKAISFAGTPDSAAAGSTYQVVATLTDKFGNPVAIATGDTPKLRVAYTGPGIVFGDLPNTSDSAGQLKFAVLLGANDAGTATVTVSYDVDNDGLYTSDNDLVVAKSITVGAAGVTTEPVATWTKNQNDGTIKVYAKNIVGAGKVQFMFNGREIAWVRAANSADPKLRTANGFYYLVRTVELVEGQKNVFEIYVDGERTTRTAYTY